MTSPFYVNIGCKLVKLTQSVTSFVRIFVSSKVVLILRLCFMGGLMEGEDLCVKNYQEIDRIYGIELIVSETVALTVYRVYMPFENYSYGQMEHNKKLKTNAIITIFIMYLMLYIHYVQYKHFGSFSNHFQCEISW